MASGDSEDDLDVLLCEGASPCKTGAKKVTASPGVAATPEYRPGTHSKRKKSAEIVSDDDDDDLQVGTCTQSI